MPPTSCNYNYSDSPNDLVQKPLITALLRNYEFEVLFIVLHVSQTFF